MQPETSESPRPAEPAEPDEPSGPRGPSEPDGPRRPGGGPDGQSELGRPGRPAEPAAPGGPADPWSTDSVRLRLAIARLHRRIVNHSGHDIPHDIPPLQLTALSRICHTQPVQLSELARYEQVSAATMCRAVDTLCHRELVARNPHPHDARAVLLTATHHGQELLARITSHRAAYLARRLRTLADEHRAAIRAALPILELLSAVDTNPPAADRA